MSSVTPLLVAALFLAVLAGVVHAWTDRPGELGEYEDDQERRR